MGLIHMSTHAEIECQACPYVIHIERSLLTDGMRITCQFCHTAYMLLLDLSDGFYILGKVS